MLERIVGRIRRNLVAIVIAIVALGGTTLAVAASGPGGSGGSSRIYACVTQEFRTLNLSSQSARCPSGQRKISWSASGRKGDRGARGAAGATGAAGAQGAPGAAGPQGAAGVQGVPGAAGAQGATGADGAAGPAGPIGPMGLVGPQGLPGLPGAVGLQGPQGDPGPQGIVGPIGPAGPQGEQGEQGEAGPIGPQGPAGDDGDQGPQGDPGPQGPEGPEGPVGAAGAPGAEGPQGPAGPSGAQQVVQVSRNDVVPASSPRGTITGWTTGVDLLSGAFDPATGVFTAPTSGTYRVAFAGTGGPSNPVTVSSNGTTWFTLVLTRNGDDLLSRRFPVQDVNVVLVLTLRVPLREATVSGEQYVTLAAGDQLALDVQNQFSMQMDLGVSMSITRVAD